MKSRRQKSSTFTVALDDGVALSRHRADFLPDGSYLFQDQLHGDGCVNATVITCAAWLCELYRLTRGEVSFVSGEKQLCPSTRSFGVLYPPFTLTKLCFKSAHGKLVGIASTHSLPSAFIGRPILFETDFAEIPSGVEQVFEVIAAATNPQDVSAYPTASLLSVKAKRLIDEHYLDYPSIGRIAKRLGVTPEHLSRQFKNDFELSPSAYLHQLRLADAPLRLARGEDIIKVSENVGYNDLSRFYKQFRKATSTSPGACRSVVKPRPA
jgi:AraC-like DNA-binding protein